MQSPVPTPISQRLRCALPRRRRKSWDTGFGAALALLCSASLTAQDEAVPVVVVEAKESEDIVHEMSLTGTVTSPRQAELSSRLDGLVSKMKVDAGHEVKKGDVLMTLDTELAELALELIEADIEQAGIEVEESRRRVEEVLALAESGGFPRSESLSRQAELRIGEAKLKRLEAAKREQQERIARHELVAPFSGVISEKLAEEGEWVDTGTPVLELVELDSLRFDVRVPQEFVRRFQDSDIQKVSVRLDAYPERPLPATISAMVPVKDGLSRTFLVRLSIEDSEGRAAPGMSGAAEIESQLRSGTSVQIPRDAVVRFPDGSAKVWVVTPGDAGEKVIPRIVRTSGQLGELAEITDGLSGGERVVIRGNEGLRENQKVRIVSLSGKESNDSGSDQ